MSSSLHFSKRTFPEERIKEIDNIPKPDNFAFGVWVAPSPVRRFLFSLPKSSQKESPLILRLGYFVQQIANYLQQELVLQRCFLSLQILRKVQAEEDNRGQRICYKHQPERHQGTLK